MAKLYDWVKLLLDNKWLVVLIFTTITSAAANVTQSLTVQEKELEIKETQQQITAVANHLTKPIKPSCSNCKSLWLNHEREFHQ